MYLARDHASFRPGASWVAIKQSDSEAAAIESRAARRVRHRNVIRMLDTFTTPAGSFCVMPHASDGTLASIGTGADCTIEMMLEMISQLASGVHAMHAAGIVHRDLKPANVLIHRRRPLLCDFGVAGGIDEAPLVSEAGSLGFISPQQYEGRRPKPTDDIYSLGGILYWMFTGECPNGSSLAEARDQLLGNERHAEFLPRLRRHVPVKLHEIILRTLSPTPSQRPQTAAEFAAAMRSLQRGSVSTGDRRSVPSHTSQHAAGIRSSSRRSIDVSEFGRPTPRTPRPPSPSPGR
ncbi:MAG: serine/threonine protein kinase [Phycisphaerales bacterium]|nr:serine/threonine protein kinase [Phycisphaerales bacterium]